MYVPTGRESLENIAGVPRPLDGAPCPVLIADERTVRLAYFSEYEDGIEPVPPTDSPQLINEDSEGFPSCVLTAKYHTYIMGPPGSERLHEHPLAELGLVPSTAFCVHNSAWLADCAPPSGWQKHARKETHWQHVIVCFHDTVFEGIVTDLDSKTYNASVRDAVLRCYFDQRD